ncbi:Multi_Drug_Res-domain-containing protein [Fragilariopsis cylindrus CCMP1102]|uniref:Multi_Drug_Res-domain-containing protein n=1 Tax=Fragilariopsis cylindrus CCMP1102 TaxID=635003 RepID=A0A1E7F5I1_9STRA|nr:Multi_Drug_Res-domain-containing protein [Fragilariopsis cylindrus CCMP1102]|eukprot:OEU13416.1 Multi_Drug_Res-domain-containing protein [Fragilariopsis cylindrus CCMP1102]
MIKRSNYFLVYAVSLLICQASGIRLPLSPTFSRGRRVQDDSTLKSMQVHERYVEISNVSSYLNIRGGGARSVISNFNEYIGESKSRSWYVLMISILIDSASAALMKTAQRDSSIKKLIVSFLGFLLSLSGFALALKSIDVSIAYAVWAALGTAIVSIAGIVLFGERFDSAKIICLAMIVLGVVGLELSEGH